MLQSVVNFCIFLVLFFAHELYDVYRLKQGRVWYVVTEVKGFKIFFLAMGVSTLVLDYYMNTTSYFTYAVFLALLFNAKREIAPTHVRIGFRKYELKSLTSIVTTEKSYGTELILWIDGKQATGFIRASLTTGLEQAVAKAKDVMKTMK